MKHSESTLRCGKFLYLFFNVFSPSFTKLFKRPRCICRTCRWENYGCHSCKRKLILFVKLSCLISVCNDLLYISRVEDFSYIGRLYIFDTAVTGTLDVTALYDIPYSYVVIKQHMFFLIYSLRHRFIQKVRQKLPETVLFVSVVEIVFPRCNGRQSAEDQYAAVFVVDRLKGVGYVFVFHYC